MKTDHDDNIGLARKRHKRMQWNGTATDGLISSSRSQLEDEANQCQLLLPLLLASSDQFHLAEKEVLHTSQAGAPERSLIIWLLAVRASAFAQLSLSLSYVRVLVHTKSVLPTFKAHKQCARCQSSGLEWKNRQMFNGALSSSEPSRA